MSTPEDALRIHGGRPLHGAAVLPADLEVAECALLFAVLGTGSSRLQDFPRCESLELALAAWTQLGAECRRDGADLVVDGVGLAGLQAPRGALDCGRSPGLLAQLAAVLSAQAFGTRLTVAAALAEHPVEHVVGVLRARGAQIAAQAGGDDRLIPPIAVAPLLAPERLLGLDATLPRADRDAKLAALISGFFAGAATTVSEPQLSADHVERMAVALGLPLRRIGSVVSFDPACWNHALPALGTIALPGSASVAAYLACLLPLMAAGEITLRHALVNPSRSGVLDMLRSWSGGRALTIIPTGDAALREPVADLQVRAAGVRGGVVGAELLARAGAALPALALLGMAARRGVRLCDLAHVGLADPALRKLDPIFAAFDVSIARDAGELMVMPQRARERTSALRRVDAGDDPELALLACTLALATPGETVVEHAASALAAVHPGFVETSRLLGAAIELA